MYEDDEDVEQSDDDDMLGSWKNEFFLLTWKSKGLSIIMC